MQSLDNVLLLKEEKPIQYWDAALLLMEAVQRRKEPVSKV